MVEHSLRMRGARGSIPLISIMFFKKERKSTKVGKRERKKKKYRECKHSCPSGLRGPI